MVGGFGSDESAIVADCEVSGLGRECVSGVVYIDMEFE